MNAQWNSRCLIVVTALVLVQLPAGAAPAQQPPPKSVTVGTNPAGTVFYAVASGLANVISGAAPFQAVVQPYTGTSTFLPLLDNGELDLGVVNAVDMGQAYQGPARLKIGGRNPFPHVPNTRLLMRGSPLTASLVVRKDSPIKTVHDVKGKRVTGEYPAHLAVWTSVFGSLATGGLTWDDVKVVPVPAVNEGIDALVQGRADVSNHAVGSAKIKEADAAIGVRYVSLDCSPQGEARIKKAVPGYYLTTLRSGISTGIVGDTCVQSYDIYLVGHKALSGQAIQATLKALWDNVEKLPPLHPQFKDWTRERAASAEVTIPYHSAAVEFYKAQGVWSAKMDETQKKLLALNP
ncbi:MAG TPA: TAXI family TRAP transporter solute-binding subunit [Candidatus Udaeobacter sp.]|nr:TAXI family TRAP transporter solute-binding subunit [Candidatus Udaeobacter sp.]